MAYTRRPFDRGSGIRDCDLIIIASEGHITERQYLEGVIGKSCFYSSRVKVITLERDDPSLSAPNHVIKELDEYSQKWELEEGDELWMVIDVDRWGDVKLNSISAECAEKGYKLAISNPCFELWLILHFDDLASSGTIFCNNKELVARLKEILGCYNKSKLNFDDFASRIKTAIENSKKMDHSPSANWITPNGSRMHNLIEKIISYSRS